MNIFVVALVTATLGVGMTWLVICEPWKDPGEHARLVRQRPWLAVGLAVCVWLLFFMLSCMITAAQS
jgi:hypothetical protein